MKYLFPYTVPSVPIVGRDERFPVHRIYCVGRNYADHVKEMGNDPDREPPFFFSKPADAVVTECEQVPFPSRTSELHHEIELVVAIGLPADHIKLAAASTCIFGYAAGIDFTRRDLQASAKQAGRPWDVAKGFDNSAPLSAIKPLGKAEPLQSAGITLKVNGNLRQNGNIADMIWKVPEVIAELSTYFRLLPGDLIFTGTPAGVGVVQVGDVLEGAIEQVGSLRVTLI
ncbi:MAG: fumarylacetoacetate hydrolase family protein [Pseudohongiellaceae bacterium]